MQSFSEGVSGDSRAEASYTILIFLLSADFRSCEERKTQGAYILGGATQLILLIDV